MTGNLRECAEMKLKSAGINVDLFKVDGVLFGGFGTDHIDRPKLVESAIRRALEQLDEKLQPTDFVVIGDTPKDMRCGHMNGVAGVAVGTGIYKASQLGPVADAVLDNFADVDKTISSFKTAKFTTVRDDYTVEEASENDP